MKGFLKKHGSYVWLTAFVILTIFSFMLGFNPGKAVFTNFTQSFIEMITFVPFLFIIVGLFDVWVPKEEIRKHIGQESGIKGIVLVVLLAMLQAGPLYGAFPVAYLLYRKGASIRNIFIRDFPYQLVTEANPALVVAGDEDKPSSPSCQAPFGTPVNPPGASIRYAITPSPLF